MDPEDAFEGKLVRLKDEYAQEFMGHKITATSRIVAVHDGVAVLSHELYLGEEIELEKLESV